MPTQEDTTEDVFALGGSGTSMNRNVVAEDELFVESLLTMRIVLNPNQLVPTLRDLLTLEICKKVENKCITEGFVIPDTVKLQEYSPPLVEKGKLVIHTKYTCRIFYPVEGIILECICLNVSRAGIRAMYQYTTDTNIKVEPLEIFICRDHNMEDNTAFLSVEEKQKITVCIISIYNNKNEPRIYAIGKLV